jgi:hypothetical protein
MGKIITTKMEKSICNSWYFLNGIKQCPYLNTTGCQLGDSVKCGLYEPVTTQMMGWECPRCGKIYSPFIPNCDCPPRTITATTTKTE